MAPQRSEIIREYFKKTLKGADQKVYLLCVSNKKDKIEIEDKHGIENDRIEFQCGQSLAGEKVSNMKYHLKTAHPQIHKRFLSRESVKNMNPSSPAQIEEQQSPSVVSVSSPSASSSKSKLKTGRIEKKKHKMINKISNYGSVKQISTSIPVTRSMLIRSLLSKVTIDGRPFSSLNDVSYSLFVKPAMNSLKIHYNNKNISDLVADAAQNIKEKLKKDLEGSLVCVKVDCATRKRKSFIGINVQLVKNGKIVVYTLAAKEVIVRHTGENLKRVILQELETYGILPKHIYTITSDNGANMVKSIKLIEEEQIKETIDRMVLEDGDTDDGEDGDPDDPDDDEMNRQLMESISDAKWTFEQIMSIRCAAHTLQLCVTDTLKKSWTIEENANSEIVELIETYTNVIAKARKVVIELNTQNVMILLHEQNLKKPSLDVPTRWGSTYTMLLGLIPLKDFCDSCVRHGNAKLKLAENEWKLIKEINLSLEPSFIATKKLQSKSNILTDIYKIWNVCQMKTAAIGSAFANELVAHMIERRDNLMENVVMLSAIYLDPRFCFELTTEQKQRAIDHICTIQGRILELQQEKVIQQSSDTDFLTDDDDDLRYEKILKSRHRQKKERLISKPTFKNTLTSFGDVKPMAVATNVLEFWLKNDIYRELCGVAEVIFSVPGTQVSVEQLFSQLKFIYSVVMSVVTILSTIISIVLCFSDISVYR